MSAISPPRPPIFHGWVIVSAVFAVLFVGFGAAYSFAAFFTSLRDEFAATRGDVSLVFSITGFTTSASALLPGRLPTGSARGAWCSPACC